MFQYALGLSLEKRGNYVKYDTSWFDDHKDYLGENRIDKVFSISIDKATENEINQLLGREKRFFYRIGKKIGIIDNPYYFEDMVVRGKYQKGILVDKNNKYLEGYWQVEAYFKDCKKQLLQDFSFRNEVNSRSKEYLSRIIDDKSSVSVHVRLGDYEKEENAKTYGGICTIEYYREAFACIEKTIENPHYYLFSNEPKRALKIVENRDCCIIDCNNEKEGWNDMYLMSLCSNSIIANSTFSWWGAYLNKNPSKTVIMPSRWTNDNVRNGIAVDGWIRL